MGNDLARGPGLQRQFNQGLKNQKYSNSLQLVNKIFQGHKYSDLLDFE